MDRRPRRNRKSVAVRSLVQETRLHPSNFISPCFLLPGEEKKEEVISMPNVFRYSLDLLELEVEELLSVGVSTICLFPAIPEEHKDSQGSYSYNQANFYLHAIGELKKKFPELTIMTDVALDPYSTDGHDGIVKNGEILNDETLDVLVKMSLAQAEAGADIVGPSDMMDGRVGRIREALELNGFKNVSIMAYSAKYASAFYGPFRDALDSSPKFGDKKTYQMNPANIKEARIEAELDEAEGADFIMVKPALAYLDVIKELSENSDLPVAAYHVSGEYAMVMAAAEKGWIDGHEAMMESLMSIKRAGASVILTYYAKEAAKNL